MFQMVKMFDCQKMPNDVRNAFFEYDDRFGNDCIIHWTVGEGDDLVDKWLLENGANINEEVVIEHWW